MTQLVITRGIPGSGKTTWAREWVAEAPAQRARVNRDDLRLLVCGRPAPLTHEEETAVTTAQVGAVESLLRGGFDVVVDDTHINRHRVTQWLKVARANNTEFNVNESFRDVPLAVCKERNNRRAISTGRKLVPDSVIEDMHARLQNAPLWEKIEEAKQEVTKTYTYVPDYSLSQAWLFDIDGTLAHMDGQRGPFEWDKVYKDLPDYEVIRVLRACQRTAEIIIFSGRDEAARFETERWLRDNKIKYHGLYMRPAGDFRKDSVVKLEMFQQHIAPHYYTLGVFDDRNQVVEMWRAIGLKCFQVAEGAF